MNSNTRRLLPILGVVALGVVLCIGAIGTLGGHRPALVLESSGAEHAVENSFFDELAAKDLAKDRRSKNAKAARGAHTTLSAVQERAVENSFFQGVGSTGAKAPQPTSLMKPPAHWQPLPYSKLVHRSPFQGVREKAGVRENSGAAPAKGKMMHPKGSMRAEFHKAQQQLASEQTKMRHIKEDFPMSMDSDKGKRSLHCSNGLYRRVKNSGKDFAKQV